MKHGVFIGGSYNDNSTVRILSGHDMADDMNVLELPRRYSLQDAAELHRKSPPRAGGYRRLPRDVYHLRTDCDGRIFWVHESLLTRP